MKKFVLSVFAVAFSLAVNAQTIGQLIENSPNHNILEQAIAEAGLTSLYEGDGPLTLFGPEDAAFQAFPQDLLAAYFTDPTGVLSDILKYHTVPANVGLGALNDGMTLNTALQGQSLSVAVDGDNVYINDALITVGNYTASNGRAHSINGVLVPETKTLYHLLNQNESVSMFTTALDASGLGQMLSEFGTYTLFVPTNAVLEALPEGLWQTWMGQPNGILHDVLQNHILDTVLTTNLMESGLQLTTLLGDTLEVTVDNGVITVGDVTLMMSNVVAVNGVAHVIDAVILPAERTVYDMVATHPDLGQLHSSIDLTELQNTLSGTGAFTMFAPTDAAIDALPEGMWEDILTDPDGELSDLLGGHVLGEIVRAFELLQGTTWTALNGEELEVSTEGTAVYVNGAKIVVSDLIGTNGVVHVVDAVIIEIPPCTTYSGGPWVNFNSIFGGAPVAENGVCPIFQITSFEVYASESYTIDGFQEGVTYTFSICDGPGAGSWEPELAVYDPNGDLLVMVEDCQITWTAPMDGTYLVGIQEAGFCGEESPNLSTDNGYPTLTCESLNTVFTSIALSDDHETLESALIAADLVETLNGEGPFTVFAPTDEAFSLLPDGLWDYWLSDAEGLLSAVLGYHLVENEFLSEQLTDGLMIATQSGEPVHITVENGDVFVNDAMIVTADVVTDNGVVHVVDAVLVPQEAPTVYDVISQSGQHTTFKTLVDLAGLADLMNGAEPLTVFAPSDDAFDAMEEGVLVELMDSPVDTIAKFIQHHVYSGIAFLADMTEGTMQTLAGETVTVSVEGGSVSIDGHTIAEADLTAINGLVHVLDGVLTYNGFSIGVDDIVGLSRLSIFPNPTEGKLNLDFTVLESSKLVVRIIDAVGHTVKVRDFGSQRTGSVRHTIDLHGLAAGIYLVELQFGDERVARKVRVDR